MSQRKRGETMFLKSILVFIALSASVIVNASLEETNSQDDKIVYGEDNRIETYQATIAQQKIAASTAGLIDSIKLLSVGDHYMLPPATLEQEMRICADERFSQQPSAVICSGFLVGPDLLVTAGHCIKNQSDCSSRSWVFDYKVNELTKRAEVVIPKTNVYHCKEVLDAKLEGRGNNKRDFALVRLDRIVKGRSPLKYRTSGKIQNKAKILVIGHPSGLPQKVTPGARVFDNSPSSYFVTNLDTFGGNSGSAVFDAKTLSVEGILVRGAKDYVVDEENQCYRVNYEDEDITGNKRLGESVSRITDIATLSLFDKLITAVKDNKLHAFKKYAKAVNLSMTTNNLDNVLHIAAKYGAKRVSKYLIDSKYPLNKQNANGETALHLAVARGDFHTVKRLLKAGADAGLVDKSGLTPEKRTAFYDIRIKLLFRYIR